MPNDKPHILYIEDDLVDQMAFKRMANTHKDKFSYDLAADIKTAIDLIETHQYSAVITDYHLGVNTAFDIIPLIKNSPIILVTGGGDESLAVRAMKMGAHDYLIKDDNYHYLKFLPLSVNNTIEHYRSKAKLKETQKVYKLLVETANDIIYKVDTTGKCTYVNEVGERITGYKIEEIIGAHFNILVAEEYKEKVFNFYMEHFKNDLENSYLEFPIIKKSGEEIWVGQNVSTIYNPKIPTEIAGFQGVVRDITDKKRRDERIETQRLQLESQNKEIISVQKLLERTNDDLISTNQNLEKLVRERTQSLEAANEELKVINKELDTFIYRASHDLKAPIARMQGLANLALTESNGAPSSEYIVRLKESAREMSQMLAKLQAVNEIKRHELSRETINFAKLISSISESYRQEITSKNISLEITENDISLITDEYLLSLILNAILENAILFHSLLEGTPRKIKISITQSENNITMDIWDNGVGISEDHIPKIFDIFFRGSERSLGNGLGLYISEKCAEKLDAKIEVQSKEGDYTLIKLIHPNPVIA